MVFKTTFTSARRAPQAGFTLVELLIATGISGLLLAVCLSLSLYTARSIASLTDSLDLGARSRYSIDRMGQKLRQASAVKNISPSSVSVTYEGRPLTYSYDAALKTLVENDAGRATTLLEDCDTLAFNYYKRNPVTNSFDQFSALTATNEVKVIQVNWSCSRTLVSQKSGSSEMASARFVLRSK